MLLALHHTLTNLFSHPPVSQAFQTYSAFTLFVIKPPVNIFTNAGDSPIIYDYIMWMTIKGLLSR